MGPRKQSLTTITGRSDGRDHLSYPPSFATARAYLRQKLASAELRSFLSSDVQQAWNEYESRVDSDLIAPLLQQVAQEGDPVDRLTGAELATVSAWQHRLALMIEVALNRGCQGSTASWSPPPTELLNQYLRLSERGSRLRRELRM
jgi:hypothetical protein